MGLDSYAFLHNEVSVDGAELFENLSGGERRTLDSPAFAILVTR